MARKRYEIKMAFTYSNGMTGGMLHTVVNSKRAVKVQLEANRKWLAVKGHTETNVEIAETS